MIGKVGKILYVRLRGVSCAAITLKSVCAWWTSRARGKLWNKNVDSSIVASGSGASILCSPQVTCANRCLSYTPFGEGHFFFIKPPNCYSFWRGFRCLLSFNSPPATCTAVSLFDKASGLSAVCGKLSPLNSHLSHEGKPLCSAVISTLLFYSCTSALMQLQCPRVMGHRNIITPYWYSTCKWCIHTAKHLGISCKS